MEKQYYMNAQTMDILLNLSERSYENQRVISLQTGYSLGLVNKSMKELMQIGYIDERIQVTQKANNTINRNSPKNAIILAAGQGMRMIPINMEVPKGLLEIHGEPLIERLIRQLKQAGIHQITIVVGFMKERFEYLIDEYQVELVVNTEYAVKNNLHSLCLVKEQIGNTYILPCDIWFKQNPFHKKELYSWYMVSERISTASRMKVTRKREIVRSNSCESGNADIGLSYLTRETGTIVQNRLEQLEVNWQYHHAFWEEALYQKDKMIVAAKSVSEQDAIEINTFEQLREVDSNSNQLKSNEMQLIIDALRVRLDEIRDITILKKGMTNRSFVFLCRGEKYMMRIPEKGTEKLMNRSNEAAVYKALEHQDFCEDVLYMDEKTGYKISCYIENGRGCDIYKQKEVRECMRLLHRFHDMKLHVPHEFQVFDEILFYESLWGENKSYYKDYEQTKEHVLSLRTYIEAHADEKRLSHIDAAPENFLIVNEENQECKVRLIDWEYAAMADPHIDIAMFGISAMYDRTHMEKLIDLYFENQCPRETRIKIYAYIAACGLFWSNWCEYKRNLGTEFGEYSLKQYRYAKEYYRIVQEELNN